MVNSGVPGKVIAIVGRKNGWRERWRIEPPS